MLQALSSRLPLELARLVVEHRASTTIQARVRGRLSRSLPRVTRHGLVPLSNGEYAFDGASPVGDSLERWCSSLPPGAYGLDVCLRYDDGTVTCVPACLSVRSNGACSWRDPLLRELSMLQHAFEPHHWSARAHLRIGRASREYFSWGEE